MKLLIDECLTTELVGLCHEFGHEATHVAWVGRQGWKDWSLIGYIVANDYTLVTNNAADFRREHAKLELHAGLIIVVPQLVIDELLLVFTHVLRYLEGRDITNRAVEARFSNGVLTIDEYPLP